MLFITFDSVLNVTLLLVDNFIHSLSYILFGHKSVQAAEHLKKKAVETSPVKFLACKEARCSTSNLFRDGIKKRNV